MGAGIGLGVYEVAEEGPSNDFYDGAPRCSEPRRDVPAPIILVASEGPRWMEPPSSGSGGGMRRSLAMGRLPLPPLAAPDHDLDPSDARRAGSGRLLEAA